MEKVEFMARTSTEEGGFAHEVFVRTHQSPRTGLLWITVWDTENGASCTFNTWEQVAAEYEGYEICPSYMVEDYVKNMLRSFMRSMEDQPEHGTVQAAVLLTEFSTVFWG